MGVLVLTFIICKQHTITCIDLLDERKNPKWNKNVDRYIHIFLETKFPINLSLVEYCLIKNQVITEKLEVNPRRNLRVFLTRSYFLRQWHFGKSKFCYGTSKYLSTLIIPQQRSAQDSSLFSNFISDNLILSVCTS